MKKTVYQFFRMSFLMVFLCAFTLNAQTGYLYFPDDEVAADITTVATEVTDPSTAEVDLSGDFTVQVSGTADTEIVLSNGIILYAYTPAVTGEVRIVKKGATVYVFEGSESKGTISSQDAMVEGAAGQSGITGVSGSVYYAAGVYVPDQGLDFLAGDYYDMTSYIVNPSFEVDGFNGWTNSGLQTQGNVPDQGWTKDGNVYVERWTNAPGTLAASSVTQTITGLPNGMYKLLAAGHAVMQGSADPTEGAFLFAGSGQTPLNVGGEYAVADVLVVGGSLTIGFKLEGTITANWAGVDNFRLQYFGVDLSSLNDLLTEKVDEAQAILDATGNPSGFNKAEVETAIANAAVVEQNEASLEAAINALDDAITHFHETVSAYGELKAALDFAATLDATTFPGKTEFDAAVAVAQGVYDSTEDKTALDFTDASVVLKAAVQTYVLSQVAPANLTSLLANPGFDVEPVTFTETNGTANGTALVDPRIFDVPGWNEELVSAWGRIATTNYGITFDPIPDVLNGTTPPLTDMSGNTEGAALKLSGSWGSPAVVTQDVTLPAGKYELSFEVINMSVGQSIGVNQFG
ncbi:MAG: FIVAR domain-containing protein, partial [Bacteroidales bacterium]|nr:FIVAR domain-containing protein [Bacteroidales bacterium]